MGVTKGIGCWIFRVVLGCSTGISELKCKPLPHLPPRVHLVLKLSIILIWILNIETATDTQVEDSQNVTSETNILFHLANVLIAIPIFPIYMYCHYLYVHPWTSCDFQGLKQHYLIEFNYYNNLYQWHHLFLWKENRLRGLETCSQVENGRICDLNLGLWTDERQLQNLFNSSEWMESNFPSFSLDYS